MQSVEFIVTYTISHTKRVLISFPLFLSEQSTELRASDRYGLKGTKTLHSIDDVCSQVHPFDVGLEPLRRVIEVHLNPSLGSFCTEVVEVVTVRQAVVPWSQRVVEGLFLDFYLETVRVLVCLNPEEACGKVDSRY